MIKSYPVFSQFLLRIFFASFLTLTFLHTAAQEVEEEDLNVFWKWLRWNNPGSLLTDYMIDQADRLYEERDDVIKRIGSQHEWQARQSEVKRQLTDLMGILPERNDLNPRITGVLHKDGYRVEKLIYESMPGFYVTGCLFIPENNAARKVGTRETGGNRRKYPAILNLIGHEQESFRAELDQIVYLNLVKKGFIVLAIDPIGQGEKVQYYDPGVKFSSVGYSVVEHCYFGNLCFLAGESPAKYFTWDGIRGIDYLISRPEVDPERIGVTGFSGGGTITSYVSALDDRVKVSVPCSWSTASRRQIETKGAQDAESILIGSLARGITFEDLVEVRAPKPTLLTFTSRDQYLSIQGAREAYEEIGKAYDAYGKPENIQYVEDDYKHWMTPKIRVKIYAFFMEHLGVQGNPAEEEVSFLTAEELTVTPTGQISTYLNAETVASLNKERIGFFQDRINASRKHPDVHLEKVRSSAKRLSGYIEPGQEGAIPFFNGRYQRQGYSVGRYAIPGEGDYAIPFLMFEPEKEMETTMGRIPAVIYLNPEGKSKDAAPDGEIEKLVKSGYVVIAPDVLGVGEVDNTAARSYTEDYTAVLLGRSTVGVQSGDIVRVFRFAHQYKNIDPERIGIIGIGVSGIPVMHAAAIDPEIDHVVLVGSPLSYRSIATNDFYRIGLISREDGGYWHPYEVEFSWGVAGALTAYDLPDLIACLAPGKTAIIAPRNELLEPASTDLITSELGYPRQVFSMKNSAANLRVTEVNEDLSGVVEWLFQ